MGGKRADMRRLSVFNQVSLDGYFCDEKGDMSWAHKDDPEWNEFVAGNASGNGMLLFGRVTYDMMVAFWPTPAAAAAMPDVAKGMNALPKVVFSRTLAKSSWKNTTVINRDPVAAVRRMKKESGPDMVILGSGSIVAQLAGAGLIDEVQLVINPLVLGSGRTLFEGLKKPVPLKLVNTRAFKNGNVLVSYQPA
jgi:dihydrofolate reductase